MVTNVRIEADIRRTGDPLNHVVLLRLGQRLTGAAHQGPGDAEPGSSTQPPKGPRRYRPETHAGSRPDRLLPGYR
jgi:hypothetical protein